MIVFIEIHDFLDIMILTSIQKSCQSTLKYFYPSIWLLNKIQISPVILGVILYRLILLSHKEHGLVYSIGI